ncbi:cytochrome o ubiquinol oxidase subunit III [Candidatus Saccharibacteria bacterium]|nr:cytochrome o ubiquinol oxidase subunit III [Candidatus Saccharibacteria bacterium]MBI3338044.1 cytochrome o ubiquinol oxidase subunit III [Candidatus Saccharibacteria bacterium]
MIQHKSDDRSTFGFWIYLMTDCVLFASLFATFAVLRNNTYGGPSGNDIFKLPFVLSETIILLTSSFTSSLMILAARRGNSARVLLWLMTTSLLGLTFLGLEISEFSKLISEGYGWQRSGFLSAFFTLVGTHGLHITIGLIWATVLMAQIYQRGIISSTNRRLTAFSMFWHFLDIVWIFIFTMVYLMGVL